LPTYEFLNTETNEEFEVFMKISEREEYLKSNPHIKPLLTAPAIVSGVGSGGDKKLGGFKEVLQKVGEKYPTSPVGEKYHSKSIKEAKTARVVKSHVDRITKRLTK
jgi:hypothetical protein